MSEKKRSIHSISSLLLSKKDNNYPLWGTFKLISFDELEVEYMKKLNSFSKKRKKNTQNQKSNHNDHLIKKEKSKKNTKKERKKNKSNSSTNTIHFSLNSNSSLYKHGESSIKILLSRKNKGKKQLLVRWKGYPQVNDSWEDADKVFNSSKNNVSGQPVTVCIQCGKGGKLISCNSCPNSYHHKCINSSLNIVSFEGSWFCPVCLSNSNENSSLITLSPFTFIDFSLPLSYLPFYNDIQPIFQKNFDNQIIEEFLLPIPIQPIPQDFIISTNKKNQHKKSKKRYFSSSSPNHSLNNKKFILATPDINHSVVSSPKNLILSDHEDKNNDSTIKSHISQKKSQTILQTEPDTVRSFAKPSSSRIRLVQPQSSMDLDTISTKSPSKSYSTICRVNGSESESEYDSGPDILDNWIQCENPLCLKWRRIPDGIDTSMFGKWTCRMNYWNSSESSCEFPEEKERLNSKVKIKITLTGDSIEDYSIKQKDFTNELSQFYYSMKELYSSKLSLQSHFSSLITSLSSLNLDILQLYNEVMVRGGCDLVTINRQWSDVYHSLPSHSSYKSGNKIKALYQKYLFDYENNTRIKQSNLTHPSVT